MFASASAIVPPAPPAPSRNRSIEARRAARLKKFKRERLVIDYLNRGVSVREIAAQMGVTEKRAHAIVREALAAHMPRPPQEFAALQISRLNEALLVAYSFMCNSTSGPNFKAINQVVRIVRELDRYHGYFPAVRRSLPDPWRPAEAKAEEPLALLADRSGMAMQAFEMARFTAGNDLVGVCHPRGSGDPESLGGTSPTFAPLPSWMPLSVGMTSDRTCARPEMAPQCVGRPARSRR